MFNIRRVAMLLFLQTVDWTVPKPGGGVNEYMEILVKETTTLHKVLSRYLALSVVEVRRFLSFLFLGYIQLTVLPPYLFCTIFQYVMTQVFAAINHRLSEEYGAIYLPDQEAKARCIFFHGSRIDSCHLTKDYSIYQVACGCKVPTTKIFCA